MRVRRISVLLAAALSCAAAAPVVRADVPTGRQITEGITSANVDRIEILSHGRKRGEIRQVAGGAWQERTNPVGDRDSDERVFDYEEVARRDGAVILRDGYRGVELTLDLAAGKVYYSDNNIHHQPLYDIGNASRAERVNGRRVRYVSFATAPGSTSPGATLSNDSGDLWVLREGNERSFFYERSRSEGDIQLRDYTNSALVGIDLRNLAAVMASTDGRQSRSASIDDIRDDVPPLPAKPPLLANRPNGRSTMQMIVGAESGDYAVLARGPGQEWTMRSIGDGRLLGSYFESGRDDWSIYLGLDPAGTQPRLRVDLYELQVYRANDGRVAYVIQDPSNNPAPAEERVARSTYYPPGTAATASAPPAPPPQAATGFHAQLGGVVYGEGGSRVGEYTNLGDGRWQDSNIYGGNQVLAEERRSADAVYLAVPGRNETIQLNLTTRRVNRLTSASTAALYDILGTTNLEPRPPPAPPQAGKARASGGSVPVIADSHPATVPAGQSSGAQSGAVTSAPANTAQNAPAYQVQEAEPVLQPEAQRVSIEGRGNPRLTRASTSPTDCGREGQRPCSTAPATFVQEGAAQGCPAGSQPFPLVRGGTCWSCPDGSSYVFPSNIEGPQACTFPASQERAPAQYTGPVEMLRCPNGGAARGLGNKCYKCPAGFLPDLLEKADGPRGCFRDNPARFAPATLTRTLACPEGSSAELLDNGNCWKCPAGFSRSGSPPSWPDACTTNIWDATFASLGAGTCEPGLENFRGVCERRGACGAQGGRPCEIGERVPSCDEGLREDFDSNSCVALQPGETPFTAGLGSLALFYGDSIVSFCKQAIGGLRFDDSTDLGVGANCGKDIFTGAACQHLAVMMGGRVATTVATVTSAGPEFEIFRRKVDAAYESERCNVSATNVAPATGHGRASGLDCPDGQFWDPNGSCYSCPDGYTRTMAPVTSASACVDKPAAALAQSACAVFRAATEELEDAVLCSTEVLENGSFVDRPLDMRGAGRELCLSVGEFAYGIFALTKAVRAPGSKSEGLKKLLEQLNRAAGIGGGVVKVADKGDNMLTAFDQLAHCK